jgi:hypothetical protein
MVVAQPGWSFFFDFDFTYIPEHVTKTKASHNQGIDCSVCKPVGTHPTPLKPPLETTPMVVQFDLCFVDAAGGTHGQE